MKIDWWRQHHLGLWRPYVFVLARVLRGLYNRTCFYCARATMTMADDDEGKLIVFWENRVRNDVVHGNQQRQPKQPKLWWESFSLNVAARLPRFQSIDGVVLATERNEITECRSVLPWPDVDVLQCNAENSIWRDHHPFLAHTTFLHLKMTKRKKK